MKSGLLNIGKQYWRKKVKVIISLLIIQITLFVFLISIGCSLMEGLLYGVGFGQGECSVMIPKVDKIEEVKSLFKERTEVDRVMGGVYQNIRSKVIFFSTGGTPFIRVKSEDLEYLIQRYHVKLIRGRLPEREDEVVVTSESLYEGESEIGQEIGKGIGANKLEMQGTYKVSGVIQADYNMVLGLSEKEEIVMIFLKEKLSQSMKDFISKQRPLYEKRYSKVEVDEFVNLFKRNLLIIGSIMIVLLFIQLKSILGSLLNVHLKMQLREMALFHTIGYNMKQIKRRIVSQYRWIFIVGTIGGIIGGQCSVILFKYLYCEIRGIYYTLWHSFYIIIPIIIIGILYLYNVLQINKELKNVEWTNILKS